MSRNDTNLLLKVVSENARANDPETVFYLTVSVGGTLITGRAISEDDFFELNANKMLKGFFDQQIKGERNRILDELETKEVDFPDQLREHFLYLDDAYYIQSGTLHPSNSGLSIQIRVADITSVSFTSFFPKIKE
ncbi:hypothetical protein QE380_000212 [Acinetobacter baylyi]|uniref:Gas vesicle protein n=1 Tax=Acinetobacter baylyi TaxID=202950 RepID=A0ABU0URW1_ACIBI|nr:hypothetical protein [Acinetobacter baylyi]MDQ1207289.1 hypothetical protein [Acinetobacter baylyi]MDR6105629.1 hypothetical protein [Acinetobacter baylyi]MDR6187650.1 hypothetical protein [Acinetobacter baylyi]